MNEEQQSEGLRAIFPDPQVAEKVVNLVVHKRPPGWSKKSNAPYYNEFYAKLMQKEIDKMIESGESIIYEYKRFCHSGRGGLSERSLYARINQSIKFLIDNLDTPDHKYQQWYDVTHVQVDRERGIILKFKNVTEMDGQPLSAQVDKPKWLRAMDDWLESNDARPFIQERIALTPEQVTDVKAQLAQLKGIMASVSTTSIKIIRTSR